MCWQSLRSPSDRFQIVEHLRDVDVLESDASSDGFEGCCGLAIEICVHVSLGPVEAAPEKAHELSGGKRIEIERIGRQPVKCYIHSFTQILAICLRKGTGRHSSAERLAEMERLLVNSQAFFVETSAVLLFMVCLLCLQAKLTLS